MADVKPSSTAVAEAPHKPSQETGRKAAGVPLLGEGGSSHVPPVQRFVPSSRSEGSSDAKPAHDASDGDGSPTHSAGTGGDDFESCSEGESEHFEAPVASRGLEAAGAGGETGDRPAAEPDALLAELSALEQSILRPLMAHVNEEVGWTLHSNRGAEICNRVVPGTTPGRERPIVMWRVRRELRSLSPKTIFDLILDVENQPVWHSYMSGGRNLGRRNGATVTSTCFKGIFPVAPRETLEHRASCFDPDGSTYYVAFTSAGTDVLDIPPVPKHERTFTCLSGYRLRPGSEPGTVDFTLLTHVDPGGNIPDWVTQKAGPKAGNDFCRDLQAAIDKRSAANP